MKPKLVLIGEVHAHHMEEIFEMEGIIPKKIKRSGAGLRSVVDRSDKSKASMAKEAIQLINRIPKREVEILKKEKIKRLFLEVPDGREYVMVFKELSRTNDFRRLKERLYKLEKKQENMKIRLVKELLKKFGLSELINECFLKLIGKKGDAKKVQKIFSLYHITIARRAGINDICPVDDWKAERELLALWELFNEVLNVEERAMEHIAKLPLGDQEKLQEAERVEKELEWLREEITKRIQELNRKREEKIAQNVRKKFVGGGAMIVGLAHLQEIKRMLKKDFEIKEYEVGENSWKGMKS